MTILLTGGAGFIGSHLVDAYIKNGFKVIAIDDLSTGKKDQINPKAKFYQGDITDNKFVESVFSQEKDIDCLNHHAAQKSVTDSVDDPILDSKINIKGSLVLLEACRKYKIKEFIFSSTGGALYSDKAIIPTPEDGPLEPKSPYGIAKLSVENYLRFYQRLGIKTKILRYSNVYGPRQDPLGEAGVVAIFCQRILRSHQVTVFGSGEQTRDFVYIKDVVRANLALRHYKKSGMWNIGTGLETPINTIAQKLIAFSHKKIKIVYQPARFSESQRSVLDCQKAKQELNWQSRIDIEQGLAKTLSSFVN